MSLHLFEGAAGTGKSTSLLRHARLALDERPLEAGQRVLGLTKVHGSRRRMELLLAGPSGLPVPAECMTLDAFALRLTRRWRSLARHLGLSPPHGDFDAIALAAAALLDHGVGAWVAQLHPVVVIDELQDFSDGAVDLLAALELHVDCITAADGFQDLSGSVESRVLDWARHVGSVEQLGQVHRTAQRGLLDAAWALRSGQRVVSNKEAGFEVRCVASAPMGGGKANWTFRSWAQHGQIAVITPTGRARSAFVAKLIDWCANKSAKSRYGQQTAGPYSVAWEATDDEARSEVYASLQLPPDESAGLSCARLRAQARAAGAWELADWARRQQFVFGRATVSSAEIEHEVAQSVRRRRAYSRATTKRRIGLTVHQAKNREFDSVVVLWPLAVKQGLEQQRRLLYNAITRAKERALVLVEDPKRDRGGTPLFAGGTD